MMEGDSNSKHFHFIIKWSRRKNSIRGLSLNEEWVEEPLRAKEEVLKFFQSRFQVIGGMEFHLMVYHLQQLQWRTIWRWNACLGK